MARFALVQGVRHTLTVTHDEVALVVAAAADVAQRLVVLRALASVAGALHPGAATPLSCWGRFAVHEAAAQTRRGQSSGCAPWLQALAHGHASAL